MKKDYQNRAWLIKEAQRLQARRAYHQAAVLYGKADDIRQGHIDAQRQARAGRREILRDLRP